MAWRAANSLIRLRDQVNAAYPNRNKASDGVIGDATHAASASDHNPNASGVVCALDLTHDPANGFDAHALVDRLRVNRHPNMKYLISNRRIAGSWTGWAWVAYDGSNSHSNHVHISVGVGVDGASRAPYDDTTDWSITSAVSALKSPETIAGEVLAGKWGNGADRLVRLRAAGYSPGAVQAIVNARLGGQAPPPPPNRPSDQQLAAQVLAGQWGNGDSRRVRLQAAGYDYATIQAIVNGRVVSPPAPGKTVDQIATEVIRGDWGNGTDRANRLRAAGYDPGAVQARVNQKVS